MHATIGRVTGSAAPWRSALLAVGRFGAGMLRYLLLVVGGSTLFLVAAPLFGYLPYSDRPGTGWFGRFPAVGFGELAAHAWHMLGFGLFFGVIFVIPAALCVGGVRLLERYSGRPGLVRAVGAALGALTSGYWMMGAAWYIAAGLPLVVTATLAGAVAGGMVLPSRRLRSVRARR